MYAVHSFQLPRQSSPSFTSPIGIRPHEYYSDQELFMHEAVEFFGRNSSAYVGSYLYTDDGDKLGTISRNDVIAFRTDAEERKLALLNYYIK